MSDPVTDDPQKCDCSAYSVPHLIGRGNCIRSRCSACYWSLDQCQCRVAPCQVASTDRAGLARTGAYTVACISMYGRDMLALDAAVERCKREGLTRASKSWLIRRALDRLDLAALIADELARPR